MAMSMHQCTPKFRLQVAARRKIGVAAFRRYHQPSGAMVYRRDHGHTQTRARTNQSPCPLRIGIAANLQQLRKMRYAMGHGEKIVDQKHRGAHHGAARGLV